MSADLLGRLRALDTCAVSDALERHELAPAVVGLARVGADVAIAGRAVTVQLGPATGEPSARHLCTAAVDASGPGDVIVVANGGRMDCAAWGGILSQAASLKQLEGIVLDGACRDVPEALQVGLAVYARGPVAVTARGRVIEQSWGEPVQIVGTSVRAGDLVIADASGVAFVPQAVADQVIETAEAIAAYEVSIVSALRTGIPVSEAMSGRYESLLERTRHDD